MNNYLFILFGIMEVRNVNFGINRIKYKQSFLRLKIARTLQAFKLLSEPCSWALILLLTFCISKAIDACVVFFIHIHLKYWFLKGLDSFYPLLSRCCWDIAACFSYNTFQDVCLLHNYVITSVFWQFSKISYDTVPK